MERQKAREIVEMIIDHAKKVAIEEGCEESPFALGWLKVCTEGFLCHLQEDDYYVKLYLRDINKEG